MTLFALEAALGLVFDPRYRDIPFAPLTAATIPFLVVVASMQRAGGVASRGRDCWRGAVLAASAVYILFNETFANWQAVWFCAATLALAAMLIFTRSSAPDAPGSG